MLWTKVEELQAPALGMPNRLRLILEQIARLDHKPCHKADSSRIPVQNPKRHNKLNFQASTKHLKIPKQPKLPLVLEQRKELLSRTIPK